MPFFRSVDENDKETYKRGCADSSDLYNDETDKCYSYDKFGVEYHECTCDDDECNGAGSSAAALAVVAVSAAVMRIIV